VRSKGSDEKRRKTRGGHLLLRFECFIDIAIVVKFLEEGAYMGLVKDSFAPVHSERVEAGGGGGGWTKF
jgi:hypothetical protein